MKLSKMTEKNTSNNDGHFQGKFINVFTKKFPKCQWWLMGKKVYSIAIVSTTHCCSAQVH